MNATTALALFALSIVTGSAGAALAHAPVENPSQVRAHGKLATAPLAAYEPTKQAPVIRIGEITIVAPRANSGPAKVTGRTIANPAPEPCQWVCGDWEDSYVGGRYQRCEKR